MPDSLENPDLAEAGRYAKRREANQRALVVLAMGLGCWIFRDGPQFVLCLEKKRLEAVTEELRKFEVENRWVPVGFEPPHELQPLSLYLVTWGMLLFFLVQQRAPGWWEDRGGASNWEIVRDGQWWRAFTALTLHENFAHLAGNLLAGALFAAYLLPVFGTGLTWMGILLSGALGNFIDAWFYRSEPRVSIGASTAVFGALGMLTACRTLAAWRGTREVRHWEIVLPVGAGLALLGFLGGEGEHIDYMAHFWGFTAGCGIGAGVALAKVTPPARWRVALAWMPAAILFGAWWKAAM